MNNYNCLLIGNYGNFNVGDELLLKASVNETVSQLGHNCTFFIPTRDITFTKIYHDDLNGLLAPIDINNPVGLFRAFAKSRIILIGGGGIWSAYTGFFAHLIPIVGLIGRLCGKELHFKSIGLYSTASRIDRWLVNLSILFANSCTVRDNESYQQMWKMNKTKVKVVEDLSIPYLIDHQSSKQSTRNIPAVPEHDRINAAKQKGKTIIGISLKPTKDDRINEEIKGAFADAIDKLISAHSERIQIVFFPFAKTPSKIEDDLKLIEGITDMLSKKDNQDTIITVSHTDPIAWYYTIKDFIDVFVGMRYHSIILAHLAGKPLLCLPYENKVREFLKGKNGNRISVLELNEINSSTIIAFVNASLKLEAKRDN
jgi:polysaccharide pyruvyl transferase WcaK-like protein